MTSSRSAGVTNLKLRQTFSTIGLTKLMASDNGHAFAYSELRLFLKENGIIHKRCALCHPTSNSLAERGIQTFKDGMKKLSGSIESHLSQFLLHYRTVPHSSTGVSPSELMFGRTLDVSSRVVSKQQQKRSDDKLQSKLQCFNPGDQVYYCMGVFNKQTFRDSSCNRAAN